MAIARDLCRVGVLLLLALLAAPSQAMAPLPGLEECTVDAGMILPESNANLVTLTSMTLSSDLVEAD